MSNNTNYQNTQEALGIAIASKSPVILWGKPGQGKTSVLADIAKRENRLLVTVIASIREPSDFAGLPNIVNGRTQLIPPGWAFDVEESGDAILFLDEISTAAPATQAALLRVVLDRHVGDHYLGDNVSIVAAANPASIAADGWDLAAPMANRFVHLDWELPAKVVQEGFAIGWPETAIPKVDKSILDREVAKARLLVSSFLGVRQELVTVMPGEKGGALSDTSGAFPTPRSWEMTATLYGYAKAASTSDVTVRMLVMGCVGEAATVEFLSYIQNLDLPDPEALLKDPKSFKVPEKGDRVFAVGLSLIAAVKADNSETRWQALGKIIAIMAKSNQADVATAIGMHWMKLRPNDTVMADADTLLALAEILQEAKLMSK